LKNMKVALFEDRREDVWFDLSSGQLRVGEVHFCRVDDFLTARAEVAEKVETEFVQRSFL